MGGHARSRPERFGSEAADILRSALRHLDAAGPHWEDEFVASAGARDLREILLRAIEGSQPLPSSIFQDPQLRTAAIGLYQRVFSATIQELRRNDGVSVRHIAPLLEGFANLGERLAQPAESNEDPVVSLRWETIELAHDFRSPLTSILFLADTLQRGHSGALNELQRRQISIVYSAALRLVSLANDVMGLIHGGDHLMDSMPSVFSIEEVFQGIVDMVQPSAHDRKLSLKRLVDTADRRVGHPEILGRILLNLTTNALKYTDEGIVEMLARSTTADHVEISVRDTGRGLDEDTIAHLYEPFRPHTEGGRRRIDSSGLGLTICRKLVHAIGSELQYETSRGWGTRFYFEVSLPFAASNE